MDQPPYDFPQVGSPEDYQGSRENSLKAGCAFCVLCDSDHESTVPTPFSIETADMQNTCKEDISFPLTPPFQSQVFCEKRNVKKVICRRSFD
jgi:hypothetical protein